MTQRILSIDVGIKNLSYCLFESEGIHKTRVVKWENVCVTDSNCKKIKIEELTEQILECLMSKFDESFEADVVLIENQPMLKNGSMKTVSVVIYTFFNMLKIMYGNIKNVRFISASNKLKCKKVLELQKNIDTYKDRKRLGIEGARLYMADICQEREEWFNIQSKKDDISDAFLLGIHYIELAF